MKKKVLRPSPKLLTKYLLIYLFWISVGSSIALIIIGITKSDYQPKNFTIIMSSIAGGTVLLLIIGIISLYYYYKSLQYSITEKKIQVHSGIIWKQIKTLPLRAVTNISIYRGIMDRILGIGILSIHTAGYSGNSSPEERLAGLINYQEYHDQIMAVIEDYKGMTQKASYEEEEEEGILRETTQQKEILKELQEIKNLLKEKL
jgi:membrane protein YdbS with pleckstrin-like domain